MTLTDRSARAPSAASSPLVVLLPGLHGTRALFDPLLRELDGLDVRALDYPNDEPLGYDDLLALVDRAVPHGTRHVVIAESFSGPIAARHAAARPRDCVGAGWIASFVASPLSRWIGALTRVPGVATGVRFAPTAAIRAMLAGPDAREETAREVHRAVRDLPPEVIRARLRAVATVDATDALARGSVPIFALGATHDRLVPPSALARIARARPDARVRTIDGPHLLAQVRPEDCAEEIRELLATIAHLHDP